MYFNNFKYVQCCRNLVKKFHKTWNYGITYFVKHLKFLYEQTCRRRNALVWVVILTFVNTFYCWSMDVHRLQLMMTSEKIRWKTKIWTKKHIKFQQSCHRIFAKKPYVLLEIFMLCWFAHKTNKNSWNFIEKRSGYCNLIGNWRHHFICMASYCKD